MTADSLPTVKTAEAAAFLGISISTLRRWCNAGLVPYWTTPGGQRRFDKAELEAWLAKRRNGSS